MRELGAMMRSTATLSTREISLSCRVVGWVTSAPH
jgi:hypothetical protein